MNNEVQQEQMPDNQMNGGKKNVLPIVLGIVAFILVIGAIAVGYYFLGKSSDKILVNAINDFSNEVVKVIDENVPDEMNLNRDISISGNLAFDTTMELEEMNGLKNLEYGFQLDLSIPKEILKLSLALQEDSKEILNANAVYQDQKGYVIIPDVLSNPLKIEVSEVDFSDVPQFSLKKDTYKKLVTDMKDVLVSSIKKENIEENKNIKSTYHDKEVITDELIYHLDSENQKQINEKMREALKNNQEFIEMMANLFNIKEEKIRETLEEDIEYDNTEEVTISVVTTGAFHKVIAIKIEAEDQQLTIVDYNQKESIQLNDQLIEFVKENDKVKMTFDYNGSEFEIAYKVTKENESKINYDIDLKTKADEEEYNIKLNGSIDFNANIGKENVKNAQDINDLEQMDYIKIYNNIIAKIKGTSLETMLNAYLSGLV